MIGDILRLIRLANNNMSLREVSEKSGIDFTHISELENGIYKASIRTLRKLASAYDLPLSQILLFEQQQLEEGLNYQKTLKMILDYYIDREEKAILRSKNYLDYQNKTKKLKK